MPGDTVNFDAMLAACADGVNFSAVKWDELWGHYSLTMRLFGPHPQSKQLDSLFDFAVLRSPTFPSDMAPVRDALHTEVDRTCQLAEQRQLAQWCLLASVAEREPSDSFALRRLLNANATPKRPRLSLSVVLYERRGGLTAHTEARLGFVRVLETVEHLERLTIETNQWFDLATLSPHRRSYFDSLNLLGSRSRDAL